MTNRALLIVVVLVLALPFSFASITLENSNIFLPNGTNVSGDIYVTDQIGIGTATPSDALEINGSGDKKLEIVTTDSSYAQIGFVRGADWWVAGTQSTTPDFAITRDPGTVAFLINNTNGRIGVAQSRPLAIMDIETGGQATPSALTGQLLLRATGASGDENLGAGIIFGQADGGTTNIIRHGASINSIQTASDEDAMGLQFNVHSSVSASDRFEAMRIEHSGRVGIGHTTPGHSLSVRPNRVFGGILLDATDNTSMVPAIVIQADRPTQNQTMGELIFQNPAGGNRSVALRARRGSNDNRGDMVLITNDDIQAIIDADGYFGFNMEPDDGFDVNYSINVTAGNDICIAGGNCLSSVSSGTSNNWSTSGNDIYFTGGNVGIGTASPSTELTVDGSINFSQAGGGTVYFGDGNERISAAGGSSYLNYFADRHIFLGEDSATVMTIRGEGSNYVDLGNNRLFNVGVAGTDLLTDYASFDTDDFYINYSSDRIGINTNAPDHTLDVAGNVGFSEYIYHNSDTDTYTRYLDDRIVLAAGGLSMIDMSEETLGDSITFGTTSSNLNISMEDARFCVGTGGCVPPDVDGRAVIEGSISVGRALDTAYSSFGTGSPDNGNIADSADVYITDDLEVDGVIYITGASSTYLLRDSGAPADIAEVLLTKKGRENALCDLDPECVVDSYDQGVEYGDLMCIKADQAVTVEKCSASNSRLVVGFISNTSVINMGNDEQYGVPVAVAGLVYAKVTNSNGEILPGDLLVSAHKPGFAMKNNNPHPGTLVGKAYDYCREDECTILTFVALG